MEGNTDAIKIGGKSLIKKVRKLINKNKPRLSIDIGSKNVKIIEGSFNGDSIDILKALEVPTPANSYHDGQIIDVDILANTIRNVLEDNNIKSTDVGYTITSNSILNRTIELPSTKDEDIANMLEFEIGQQFPINLDDYVTQSKVIEKVETEPKKSIVVVSVLPKLIVEEYLSLTNALSLNAISLDTHSNAMSKLLYEEARVNGELGRLEKSTIALLDIGFNYTNVIIIERGNFKFNRLIDFGGKNIDTNIANSFNLSVEESEEKRLEIRGLGIEDENLSLNLVKEVIENTIDNLYTEIEKIFKFYTSRTLGNEIERIYLYGSTSNTVGLDTYIQSRFNIATYAIKELGVIGTSKYENENLIQYLNAIGALIRR